MESSLALLTGCALIAIGLAAMVSLATLMRKLLAFNVMGSGVFLVLVALAPHTPQGIDPIAQALVLTGIVVAISGTALGLLLVRRLHAATNRTDLSEDDAADTDD